jgi:ABC-2 type transport system ATP-binding protein
MQPIIQVENLTKTFTVYRHYRGSFSVIRNLITSQSRLVKAVDQVTFQVNAGEVVGYLGPNGAGKSTTIKMLTGLLVPTSGNLSVNGFVPWRDRKQYVRRIGAVFGQRTTLWWDLPVIESLDLLKYIYDIPHPQYDESLREFKRFLALDEFLDIPVRSLSLGQRMRADLCAAMLHNPELIYLDEPTIGLDVVAKESIRKFIQHMNRSREVTVILTTHDLSDIEKLCDRVMIIDKGRLLYDGTLVSLNEQFGGKRRLVVDFSESYDAIQIQDAEIVTKRKPARDFSIRA